MAVPLLLERRYDEGTTRQLGSGQVTVDSSVVASGEFLVRLTMREPNGTPIQPDELRALVAMEGHAMPPVMTNVMQIGAGSYEISGRLPMHGNWRLKVDGGSEQFNVDLLFAATL
jgi:hypothetical protein